MSKKSRRRNKKILGVLGALGAAALLGRKGTAQGVSGSDKAKFTSDAAYTAPVTGTNYPGENKVAADSTAVDTSKGNWTGYGHPIIRGNVKRKKAFEEKMTTPGMGTAVAPPSILNPYSPRVIKGRLTNRGTTFKSGGRVKGGGKAKRGLGRAFTKAKK